MGYAAKVVADSVNLAGCRLVSIELCLPRIVLAELNTHRDFSRNSSSSRAVPVTKMIQRALDDPFLPVWWGAEERGMQAREEIAGDALGRARARWLDARDAAVAVVRDLVGPDIRLHKQIANRLLEPFLWHTVIISATEWSNFFALRCHPDAQPEMRHAAVLAREAIDASKPRALAPGEWHLPYVEAGEAFDLWEVFRSFETVAKVSVGRCARVSTLTHDGKRDPQADVGLSDRLRMNGHMSPYEHAARADGGADRVGNFRGFTQFRKLIPNEHDFSLVTGTRTS